MTSWQWQERVLSHMRRRGGNEGAVVVLFRVFRKVYFYMKVLMFLGGVVLCCSVGVGICVREDINENKKFSFGHCPNEGGGDLPMAEFFGPSSRSAFLVNKKSLFLQKCQCIELLTVF